MMLVHRSAPDPLAASIFAADGEMAALCRQLDWSATSLGPLESWPQSLRTAAGMVVSQGIAQALCWGPDLIQIYNDEYRVIMRDKHPAGLGRPTFENWWEIREDIEPLFARVMAGETLYFEDLPFLMMRSGYPEETYFTFSYSPVRTESGTVGGALINCFETTDQVKARAVQAERDRLFESLKFERSRLEYVFEQAPTFLAVLRGREHVFEMVNPAYSLLISHRDVIGKPARTALPEVVDQGFIELLDRVLETGEPFAGVQVPVHLERTPGAPREEHFVDFMYFPFNESDGTRSGVIAHGYDVTAMVRAHREVERLLAESEAARSELQKMNRRFEEQQTELELTNQHLQENTAELEAQAEELQNVAAAMEERTEEAEHARRDAEQARDHLHRVIAQAPVAMYIARGRDHVFEVVNDSYYRMVGKTPEQMIGRSGREVFPELVPQGVFDIIEGVFDSGMPFHAPEIAVEFDADGDGTPEPHYFNLVYQPLLNAEGAVYAIGLVATEVTGLVAARKEAQAAQKEAEEANRAKADFLASMSHELRTPLNAIGGYVNLIEMGIHGPVTEAQLVALDRVRVSQQHLLTLINDVLSFAKIEAGHITLDERSVSVQEALRSVEVLMAPIAGSKRIHLTVDPADSTAIFRGDEERVRQILLNLVENAIKFTEAGGSVTVENSAAEWIDIRVRDTGTGIEPEKQERIFEPFVQLERRFSNPREGVGLGLAISRDLARAMGGDLMVESSPGLGSTFTLRLPRART